MALLSLILTFTVFGNRSNGATLKWHSPKMARSNDFHSYDLAQTGYLAKLTICGRVYLSVLYDDEILLLPPNSW